MSVPQSRQVAPPAGEWDGKTNGKGQHVSHDKTVFFRGRWKWVVKRFVVANNAYPLRLSFSPLHTGTRTYIYLYKRQPYQFQVFCRKNIKKNNLPSFRATYMWYSEGNPMPNSFQRTHLSFNANSLFLCDLFSSTMKKKRDKRAQGKWSSFLLKSWHTQQNSQSFAFSNHGSLVRPRHFSFFCFVSWLPHKFRVI